MSITVDAKSDVRSNQRLNHGGPQRAVGTNLCGRPATDVDDATRSLIISDVRFAAKCLNPEFERFNTPLAHLLHSEGS